MKPIIPSRERAEGFSLLELMVTLVLLSIGLLGIALMQTTGLGVTKTAYSRTQAMLLASDLADRIRANEKYAANYVGTFTPTARGTPACLGAATCAGPAMATSDLTDWSNRLVDEFPAGVKGEVLDLAATPDACSGYTATAVPAGFMRVIIKWGESATSLGALSSGDCYQFDFVY